MAYILPDIIPHDVEARFWEKVDRRNPDECWQWTGCRMRQGYGRISVGNNMLAAHRIALWLATGDNGSGRCALHSCDNPPCVNSNHLRWGTLSDNNADMRSRGRANQNKWNGRRAGSANPRAKLNDDQVRQILAMREVCTRSELAIYAGVSLSTIGQILNGKRWTHLTHEPHKGADHGRD